MFCPDQVRDRLSTSGEDARVLMFAGWNGLVAGLANDLCAVFSNDCKTIAFFVAKLNRPNFFGINLSLTNLKQLFQRHGFFIFASLVALEFCFASIPLSPDAYGYGHGFSFAFQVLIAFLLLLLLNQFVLQPAISQLLLLRDFEDKAFNDFLRAFNPGVNHSVVTREDRVHPVFCLAANAEAGSLEIWKWIKAHE